MTRSSLVLAFSLASLTACRHPMVDVVNTDVVGMDDGGGSDLNITVGAPNIRTAPADTGDTANGDTGGATTEPGCEPFVIEGDDDNSYTVTSMLVFSLNSDSPTDTVTEGYPTIIAVDATALCGDVVLTNVYFSLSGSSADGSAWIAKINDVSSTVEYDYDGMGHGQSYGEFSSNPVSFFDTEGPQRAMWTVPFTQPIVIEKNATFTFLLAIEMGGDSGLQPASTDFFYADLENFVSWYGTDNPDLYPATSILDSVGTPTLTLIRE